MKTRNDEVVFLFQDKVSELLLRHRSILDTLSQHAESAIRVNKSITRTVTSCGCISVNARKQHIPPEVSLEECRKYLHSHIEGSLCESCKEMLEEEMGNNLFYLAAICHLLDIQLDDIIKREYNRLEALGYFHLS
jgi:NTP pyrophosphatase (non-canonical NTP hydrolase)